MDRCVSTVGGRSGITKSQCARSAGLVVQLANVFNRAGIFYWATTWISRRLLAIDDINRQRISF